MKAYRLEIQTEGLIRGAAREIGRLVETGSYLSNTSLYYALGISSSRYVDTEQKPQYIRDTKQAVEEKNIYVAPARPLGETNYTTLLSTVSGNEYAKLNLSGGEDPVGDLNFPKIGKEKVLKSENKFETFIISEEELDIPKYFRLGKKRGKCKLTVEEADVEKKEGEFTSSHPIGAYDTELTPKGNLITRKIRPAPLILQAKYEGSYYEIDSERKKTLPRDLEFLKQKR